MAEITASLVKELRVKTGAGMMDCKKALNETDGNLEEAVDWLRTNGLASAQKKSGRVAAEGLVAVATSGTMGACVEVNAETDFVARNETFQEFVGDAAQASLTLKGDMQAVLDSAYPNSDKNFSEQLTHHIATIGENMSVRRSDYLEVSDGIVVSYIHSALRDNMGKIGVLIALESAGDKDKLQALGHKIAMHVAAARPEFLSVDTVDADALERERNILTEQARASGKPEEIIGKMVEGRLRKYYEEAVLLEQIFVMDGESKISNLLAELGKEMSADVTLKGFVRFQLGEGVEKEKSDFASEVASVAKG